jgi:hypothetical protein
MGRSLDSTSDLGGLSGTRNKIVACDPHERLLSALDDRIRLHLYGTTL